MTHTRGGTAPRNASLNDDATKLVFNDVKDLRTFAQRKKTSDAKLPTWVSL